MFNRLKNLFDKADIDVGEEDQLVMPTAAAMLLFEVAWADHEISDNEVTHIGQALTKLFELTPVQVSQIVNNARNEHKESTSMYSFTRTINESFNQDEKTDLLTAMWQMALSDTEIHKYEEHIIRKISELIYVSHSEFIRSKLLAKKRLADQS